MSAIILGIESSCDDTSAAVIKDGYLLSNVVSSQAVHEAYGGVVPELASRAHQQNIVPVVHEALKRAGVTKEELSAVAFTRGPGLMGSLLVGVSFAKGFARSLGIPLIDVNHLTGHVLAHFIKAEGEENIQPKFPFLCLLVSGGNSQIILVKAYNDMEILGQTIDDAAGEAIDKCSKVMGLGYPGGPKVDKAAKEGNNISIISVGWDPGMFSLNRLYAESILVQGSTYTFWGKGVSQGHSDAIRRIDGVKNAIQYTVPIEDAVEQVRSGSEPELTTRQKHLRECYVVAEEGADKAAIENAIKTMPNYFSDYDTTVTFITEEELKANHSKMPHGGFVIRTGETGCEGNKHVIEYSLKLDSNPEFTGSVLVAYARAAHRLSKKGECGARSVFDIAPAMLSQMSAEELRAHML